MISPLAVSPSEKNQALVQRGTHFCLGLAAACLVYAALASTANVVRLARQPFQFDYEEGNVLNAAVRINAGLTPYPAPHSWPVVLNSYGPVPYFIAARLIRSGEPEFFRPRMAVIAAALIVALEIGLLTGSFTGGGALLEITFGAFFLTLPLVQQWTPLLRVDMMGLAFSLAGLVVVVRWRRLWLLTPLFFVLALLCKVTFLAAPITCATILARQKRWRELALGTLAGGVILGGAVAALQWSTRGAFLFHQLGTHTDPFSWPNYWSHASHVLGETSVLIALTVIAVLRPRRLTDAMIYVLLACLVTLTGVKLGSESNHFLEVEAALCIAAAVGLHELQKMKARPPATAALVVLCGAILAIEGVANRALYNSRGAVDECAQAYAYIRGHEHVLSENVGALVVTGRPVLLSNPYVYAQLVRSGTWPSGQVEQMLQEGAADLVIIGKPEIADQRWSHPALEALAANYHVTRRFVCADATVACEPNLPPAAPSK